MTFPRVCPACGPRTTKQVKFLARHAMCAGDLRLLYVNCNTCHSTLVVIPKSQRGSNGRKNAAA